MNKDIKKIIRININIQKKVFLIRSEEIGDAEFYDSNDFQIIHPAFLFGDDSNSSMYQID
jgi:hypothetical protein